MLQHIQGRRDQYYGIVKIGMFNISLYISKEYFVGISFLTAILLDSASLHCTLESSDRRNTIQSRVTYTLVQEICSLLLDVVGHESKCNHTLESASIQDTFVCNPIYHCRHQNGLYAILHWHAGDSRAAFTVPGNVGFSLRGAIRGTHW